MHNLVSESPTCFAGLKPEGTKNIVLLLLITFISTGNWVLLRENGRINASDNKKFRIILEHTFVNIISHVQKHLYFAKRLVKKQIDWNFMSIFISKWLSAGRYKRMEWNIPYSILSWDPIVTAHDNQQDSISLSYNKKAILQYVCIRKVPNQTERGTLPIPVKLFFHS